MTEALAISTALERRHPISDQLFDRLFPSSQRIRSAFHWTPIDIALRACALLAPLPDTKVLDVGAGVGKLCLVGALTTRGRWFGIERDADMVRAALAAARRLGVEQRASFAIADVSTVEWTAFDAFYLFNPFAEGLFRSEPDALTRREIYVSNIERVRRGLEGTRPGTRVVTYHGFGGDSHLDGFELVHREQARDDALCLWVRRDPGPYRPRARCPTSAP
jgi:SAM-dependent methyltransferase